MSAIASDRADNAKGRLRPMREDDLDTVMEIERRAYDDTEFVILRSV